MKTFNEWLVENHPDCLEEVNAMKGWRGLAAKALLAAPALSGIMPSTSQAAEPVAPSSKPAVVQSTNTTKQMSDPDIIEKNGYVYIRGTATPKDDSPKAKMNAARVAEAKLMQKASKYFASKGGRKDFMPGGYDEITSSSDFLRGKSDHITWRWKIPN